MELEEERNEIRHNIRLAFEENKPEEAILHFTNLIDKTTTLSFIEAHLFANILKKYISPRRISWKQYSLEGNSTLQFQISNEIEKFCKEFITLINKLLARTFFYEGQKTLYMKMKADSYKYIAQITTNNEIKQNSIENAQKNYQDAIEENEKENFYYNCLMPTPVTLACNFAVFNYEFLNDKEKAIKITQKAFDDALREWDGVCIGEDGDRELTKCLGILRDNLNVWNLQNDAQTQPDDDLNYFYSME